MELMLIILGEDGAEGPVGQAEDHRVGQGLHGLARTRREGEKETRGQEDEEEDGNEDIRIKRGHFTLR